MALELRPYQQEALAAALEALAVGGRPVLQLATGTGKSLIIAALAEHYRAAGQRVWVLTHIQQLIEQNAATYAQYAGAQAPPPGVVCAGLGRRDLDRAVTFGTIQSLTGAVGEMPAPGLIIIDEAHRVPHSRDGGSLYAGVLRRVAGAARVALTATPWRTDNGRIHGAGEEFWFDRLAYSYPVTRAVAEGYLCPLVGVETEVQLDLEGVRRAGGDYVSGAVEGRTSDEWLRAVARSLPELTRTRHHLAVYCPTINIAQRAAAIIAAETGWTTGVMAGGLARGERADALERFTAGATRVLCSVDMITTGFDFPALDCIVCLRPTLSSSLWVQMQGRGTRLAPGKRNCLVLDYVGNLQRLGGVDMYERFYRQRSPADPQPAVPRPAASRPRAAATGVERLLPVDPMTGGPVPQGGELWVGVRGVGVVPVVTRRAPGRRVLMVSYDCATAEGTRLRAAAFIDTEAGDERARGFFARRGLAVNLPARAERLTWQARGARVPRAVKVRRAGRYWNVIAEDFGDSDDAE